MGVRSERSWNLQAFYQLRMAIMLHPSRVCVSGLKLPRMSEKCDRHRRPVHTSHWWQTGSDYSHDYRRLNEHRKTITSIRGIVTRQKNDRNVLFQKKITSQENNTCISIQDFRKVTTRRHMLEYFILQQHPCKNLTYRKIADTLWISLVHIFLRNWTVFLSASSAPTTVTQNK